QTGLPRTPHFAELVQSLRSETGGSNHHPRRLVTPDGEALEHHIGMCGLDYHIGVDGPPITTDRQPVDLLTGPVGVVEGNQVQVIGGTDAFDDRPGQLPTRPGDGYPDHPWSAIASVSDSSNTWRVVATSSSVWAAQMNH